MYFCIYESRAALFLACLIYLLFSLFLFKLTGLWGADATSLGFDSQEQLLGLILLMTVLPIWLIGCLLVTQRHSLAIARQLDPLLADKVTSLPSKYLWVGALCGMVYALAFNVPLSQFSLLLAGSGPMMSLFAGQILVWVFIGGTLAIRLYVGSQFHEFGKTVPINVFEQTPLEPFARVGLLDVAIVVGGIAISTVQSIDAQFRLYNYLSALIIAIPAAIALLIRPMWSVHIRLRERKRVLQAQVRTRIQAVPEDTADANVQTLEPLLQRRDRVDALHTWPLDFSIWSRLFFYGLIPPLAWLAAALVEIVLERIIGL